YINGLPLQQLLSNDDMFAMPSYNEGLPIALLEAMSHRLDVAVSDIPACIIKPLDRNNDYFPVGNKKALAELIQRKLSHTRQEPLRRDYDLSDYNWDIIADQTVRVYQSLVN
ncbi:MAG: glycosyltransferase, partial [Muribaculum sp.]|nr:glycosyltransferase [Muribaculum sp.]